MKPCCGICSKRGRTMEFHEKLQELRKRKGLTQEALAERLYVSRAAISKWESGRGYPNIDSLKAIAQFHSVTIDELLSGEEVLTIAEETHRQQDAGFRRSVFGLLDCSAVLLWFVPLFGQTAGGAVEAVSLLGLTHVSPYMYAAYLAAAVGMLLSGILTLVLKIPVWESNSHLASLLVNGAGLLLWILSPQPYAAAYLFVVLAVKVIILKKQR